MTILLSESLSSSPSFTALSPSEAPQKLGPHQNMPILQSALCGLMCPIVMKRMWLTLHARSLQAKRHSRHTCYACSRRGFALELRGPIFIESLCINDLFHFLSISFPFPTETVFHTFRSGAGFLPYPHPTKTFRVSRTETNNSRRR